MEVAGGRNTDEVDADLASVVAAWPSLPEHIKAAILTLIESTIVREDPGD